ncbi:hypothetical protein AB0K51_07160 [Kitasatospora sp. NPDC049285]|uniref:hypothetical protein n=1 Tax=Kitasatospora sp. NPDC049285 TaxID=3157096 RepID=UPI0034209150
MDTGALTGLRTAGDLPDADAPSAAGWRYVVDQGYDPAGRVPGHAVQGGWPPGPDAPYRPNPGHGRPPRASAATASAAVTPAPLPPLGAGRRPAARALLSWLDDERAPRLCRVTGSSGSGRTHLLTWLAAACPPDHPRPGRRVHALLDAEGLTVRSATARLADLLGVFAREPADLLTALQDGQPRVVVVTDLDRAGNAQLPGTAARIARELLAPLLALPWLLLLVDTAHEPAARALTTAAPAGAVLDLDEPQWTDPGQFAAWCAQLAGRQVDPAAVHPSPGLALLAARIPPTVPLPRLPAGTPVGERAGALAATWWAAVPPAERAALQALHAAEAPVSTELWATLPGAGGPAAVHAAAELLPPPAVVGRRRLRPEVLARQVAADTPPVDHPGLMWEIAGGIPSGPGGRPDLAAADPERLALLVQHAAAADPASPLLDDPDVLLHAEPAAVTAAFERAHAAGAPVTALAAAWQLAAPDRTALAHPAERAGALHAWLVGREPAAAAHCAAVAGPYWRTHWSRPAAGPALIALGRGPLTGQLLLAADGRLGLLDPATGQERAVPLPLTDRSAVALACAGDGGALHLSPAGPVSVLPLGGPIGAPSSAAVALPPVTALATLDDALAHGTADGRTGCRLLAEDTAHEPEQPLHDGPVTAIALAEVDGGTLVVSGGAEGRVHSWMPARAPLPEPIDARPYSVTALAVSATPAGLLLAAAWSDGLLRLRRWGAAATALDLRLGNPATALAVTPDGLVLAALPEALLALTLE